MCWCGRPLGGSGKKTCPVCRARSMAIYARRFGLPEGTTKKRISAGRMKLKEDCASCLVRCGFTYIQIQSKLRCGSSDVSKRVKGLKRTRKLTDQPDHSAKRQCVVCLMRVGFGRSRVADLFGMAKRTVTMACRDAGLDLRNFYTRGFRRKSSFKLSAPVHLKMAFTAERESVAKFDESRHWANHPEAKRHTRKRASINPVRASRSVMRTIASNDRTRIIRRLRLNLWLAVKHNLRPHFIREFVGCSIDDLKRHLESKFLKWMTWDNYGMHTWHVDHIVPCAAFDLRNVEHIKAAFHWSNLQPMPAKENRVKSCKLSSAQLALRM